MLAIKVNLTVRKGPNGFSYDWTQVRACPSAIKIELVALYIQGVQRIYERFCNYKAINEKLNNLALKFLIF